MLGTESISTAQGTKFGKTRRYGTASRCAGHRASRSRAERIKKEVGLRGPMIGSDQGVVAPITKAQGEPRPPVGRQQWKDHIRMVHSRRRHHHPRRWSRRHGGQVRHEKKIHARTAPRRATAPKKATPSFNFFPPPLRGGGPAGGRRRRPQAGFQISDEMYGALVFALPIPASP